MSLPNTSWPFWKAMPPKLREKEQEESWNQLTLITFLFSSPTMELQELLLSPDPTFTPLLY